MKYKKELNRNFGVDIFKMLEKNELSIKNSISNKNFSQNLRRKQPLQDKQKAESVLYYQHCPEERLKGVLQPEMKGHQTVIQINKKKLRISVKETAYVKLLDKNGHGTA